MHTPSLFVASVAVLSTFASAEGQQQQQRPRFYFPRAIKRPLPQFVNTTITRPPPQDTARETSQDVLSSRSTKRSLSDIFAGFPSSPSSSAGTTGDLLASLLDPVSPTTSAVKTVVISQTTTVGLGGPTAVPSSTDQDVAPSLSDPLTSASSAASTGDVPPIVILPTPSSPASTPDSVAATTADPPSSSSAAGSGITFGPGGILTGGTTTSSSPSSLSTPITLGVTFSGTGGSTATAAASTSTSASSSAEGLLPSLSGILSSLLDPTTPTPTPTPVSTSADPSSPSSSAAATSIVGTDPLSSILASATSALLPPPSSTGITGAASTGVVTSTGAAASTGVATPVTTPDPVSSAAATTSSTGLGSLLSSIIASDTSVIGSIISPSSPPTITSSPVVTPTPPPTTIISSGTGVSDPASPTTSGTIVITGSSNSTSTPPSSPTTTELSSGSVITTGPASPTVTASGSSISLNGTASPPASPVTTDAPSNSTSGSLIFTVTPTTTDTGAQFFPTSIIAQPTSSLAPGESLTAAPTTIPSSLPHVVANPNGTVVQPENTELVQIGFDCSLNYQFVVGHSQSSAQIFAWLQPGVVQGLGVNSDEVLIHSLIPWPITGCVTTVAQTFIPQNMVDTMAFYIKIASSPLYQSSNGSIAALMDKINPAIPLIGGGSTPGDATGTGSGAAATSTTATSNNGLDGTNGQASQSPQAAGTTAGFAVLAVGGALSYGAAMFLVARRYKRKRQSHRRSSSTVGPEMRYSGSPALLGGGVGAFMSGGRTSSPGNDRNSRGSGRTGNSARTQQISAPMMAENSLGWN